MSQYVQFFLNGNKQLFPIGTYSKSTYMFQLFQYRTRYGEVIPLTQETINDALSELNNDLKTINHRFVELKERKSFIKEAVGISWEDKIDDYNYITEMVSELETEKKEIKRVRATLKTFLDIIEEVEYSSSKRIEANKDNYLYVGFEVACAPNLNDIEEDI